MSPKKLKFAAGVAVILSAVFLLAMSAFEESKAYYQTVAELKAQADRAQGVRVRVAGNVVPGSILRRAGEVAFDIEQDGEALTVVYVGREPLPDTLVDRAQAVAEGHLRPDGTFEASHVQAKCASKYEAEYPEPGESTED